MIILALVLAIINIIIVISIPVFAIMHINSRCTRYEEEFYEEMREQQKLKEEDLKWDAWREASDDWKRDIEEKGKFYDID